MDSNILLVIFLGMDGYWIWQSHLDWSDPDPRPQRRGWWRGWRPVDRKWRRRETLLMIVDVVVLCSGAGSGLRLRRENIGRYNGRVAASAVQASVHQLNNPGFLTFLRRLLEIRDKCLVKSNSIYNPQNSANPSSNNYPPTLSTVTPLCRMIWSHLWVHLWKYFAALARSSQI